MEKNSYNTRNLKTLQHVKKTMDESKRTIAFIGRKTLPKTIEEVVENALALRPTRMVTEKSSYTQVLGSTRSLEDIYLMCKHYIPNVQIEDIAKYLTEQINKVKIGGKWCCTHYKFMFFNITIPECYKNDSSYLYLYKTNVPSVLK